MLAQNTWRAFGLTLIAAMTPSVLGDVYVSQVSGSGSLTVNELQEVSGLWNVDISVTPTPFSAVHVTSDDGDIVRYVKVRQLGASSSVVSLHVGVINAPLSGLNSLSRVEGSGRVWLSVVTQGGNIGSSINAVGEGIEAELIQLMYIQKDGNGNGGDVLGPV